MTPEQMAEFMKLDEAGQNDYLAQQFGGEETPEGESAGDAAGEDESAEEGANGQQGGGSPGPEQGDSQITAARPQAPAAQPTQDQQRERMVPHGAMHAEREKARAAEAARLASEAKVKELEAQLAAAQQQQSQTPAPDLMFEKPEAIQAIVQQSVAAAIAPLQQAREKDQAVIGHLSNLLEQAKAEQEVHGVSQQFQDPDAAELLRQFDAEMPHYKQQLGLNAAERYAMAATVRNASPEYRAQQQAAAEAKAREAGIARQEAALGSQGKRQTPSPTLQGIPPAVPNGAAMDPSKLGFKQIATMSDDEEDRVMRQALGG